MAETKDEERIVPGLHPSRLHLSEEVERRLTVHPETGVRAEDLLKPSYWTHVGRDLRMYDLITAIAEDGTWEATYRVLDSGLNFAKVSLREKYDMRPEAPSANPDLLPGHTVQWGGPHAKWRVLRDVDKKVLKFGFAQQADAFVWLAGYAQSVRQETAAA